MSFTTQSLSVGDGVQQGTYQIHSRFNHAVNFISRGKLVSVVDKEVGAGPRNIVLDDLKLARVDALEIGERVVVLGSQRYPFSHRHVFRSRLEIAEFNPETFQNNLSLFETLIVEFAPAKSLAFILDRGGIRGLTSTFEQAFLQRITRGVELIFAGQVIDGVRLLKGCGPGLTPSGDDFIAGLLFGVNFLQEVLHRDFKQLIDVVHQTARSGNIFSQTFLDLAREGRVFERLKALIHALNYAKERELHACAERLFAVGASSGADLATGFLKTVQAGLCDVRGVFWADCVPSLAEAGKVVAAEECIEDVDR